MKDWRKETSKEIKKKMIQKKIDPLFETQSFFEACIKKCVVTSEMSHCLFYNVGAIIFRKELKKELVSGFNGPSCGDVHCDKVGCARIIDGKLKKGSGLCRGSHAEMNAISNAADNGVNIRGASMIITYQPCFSCAKQIVNAGIKEVFYILSYDGDEEKTDKESVPDYLRRLGVNVAWITSSEQLEKWIDRESGFD